MQTPPAASVTPEAFPLSEFAQPSPVATGSVVLPHGVRPPRGMKALADVRHNDRALHDAPNRHLSGHRAHGYHEPSYLRWGKAWMKVTFTMMVMLRI